MTPTRATLFGLCLALGGALALTTAAAKKTTAQELCAGYCQHQGDLRCYGGSDYCAWMYVAQQ